MHVKHWLTFVCTKTMATLLKVNLKFITSMRHFYNPMVIRTEKGEVFSWNCHILHLKLNHLAVFYSHLKFQTSKCLNPEFKKNFTFQDFKVRRGRDSNRTLALRWCVCFRVPILAVVGRHHWHSQRASTM